MRQIPDGFLIPDFGPRTPAPTTPAEVASPTTAATAYAGPRKLAIICSRGTSTWRTRG